MGHGFAAFAGLSASEPRGAVNWIRTVEWDDDLIRERKVVALCSWAIMRPDSELSLLETSSKMGFCGFKVIYMQFYFLFFLKFDLKSHFSSRKIDQKVLMTYWLCTKHYWLGLNDLWKKSNCIFLIFIFFFLSSSFTVLFCRAAQFGQKCWLYISMTLKLWW